MKLLQWNVWYKEDLKNILSTLQKIDADIICLQEVTVDYPPHKLNAAKFLADNLKLNHFYQNAQSTVTDNEKYSFGNAIFTRYPVLEKTSVFVQQPTSESGDYSQEGRVYLEVRLETESGPLTVGTVHLSYTDRFLATPGKENETRKLLSAIQEKKERFVVAGDFNSLPDSYTITELSKCLKNAGPDFAQKTWTTKPFSYNGFNANTLDWRLDYCFATPDIQVLSAQTIDTPYSDHLPILIEFK